MLSKMKILIVDDEPDICSYFSKILQSMGFLVESVLTLKDARKALEKNGYSILICDQSLPDGSGEDLIRWCRTIHTGYIYIIAISANCDDCDILDVIDIGADEFIPKPIKPGELITRVRVGERIMSLEKSLESTNERLQRLYEKVKTDLKSASIVQKSLLPKNIQIENITMSQLFVPAEELSGDLYNVIHLNDKLIIYHLDASGHGVASSLFSVMVYETILNAIISENLINPWDMMEYLNKRFMMNQQTKQYFTIFYGVLDLTSLRLRYAQNGQKSLILMRPKEAPVAFDSTGPPIGLFPDIFGGESDLLLKPLDKLILFSDGVIDSKNPNGEFFGEERMLDCMNGLRKNDLKKAFSKLMTELEDWMENTIFVDDVSLLGFEISKDNRYDL